eukprot:scaffold77025_cov19-Prasinocladus_malaysianus.AAC.1
MQISSTYAAVTRIYPRTTTLCLHMCSHAQQSAQSASQGLPIHRMCLSTVLKVANIVIGNI